MGHPVLPQHREVHGGEELLVPDLDRVAALAGQGAEELVEPGGEALGRHAGRPADGLKLEDERPGMVGEVPLVGLVDRFQEQIGAQKIRIDLAGPGLVLRLAERVHGELVPHLAHAGKSRRQVLRVRPEHLFGGGRVETGVDADGTEEGEGGIFLQHPRRGAPPLVLPMIDEAAPPGVVPRGRAEPHVGRQARREGAERLHYLGTIRDTSPSAFRM